MFNNFKEVMFRINDDDGLVAFLNGNKWMDERLQSLPIEVRGLLEGSFAHGVANGYVAIPNTHKSYVINVDDISVHGGITYDHIQENYRVIGFDTNHHMDNKIDCDFNYCKQQLLNLLKQIKEMSND